MVTQIQKDILSGQKSVTDLLRVAKLISVKLGLPSVEEWIDKELKGYTEKDRVPEYRRVSPGVFKSFNPYHGWITVGGDSLRTKVSFSDPISTIEEYSKQEHLAFKPQKNIRLTDPIGGMGEMVSQSPQQFVYSGTIFKTMVEAVKDQLLDWSTELEKKGIQGDDMSFNEAEKEAAHSTVFNIANMHGVIGDVNRSQVAIYDYSTVHKELKDAQVSQDLRNQIEDMMDELKAAPQAEKRTLTEKAKQWIVENEKVLGAGAAILRKALGFE